MTTTDALAIGAGLALLAALHPYVTFPLSLLALTKLPNIPRLPRAVHKSPEVDRAATAHSIAILLCVHNEERIIADCIRNLLTLIDGRSNARLHVYSDGSTDRTAEVLQNFANRIELIISDERRGKTHGMNVLVSRANAQLLVFTDAAVVIRPGALQNILKYYEDTTIGCVSGRITTTQRTSASKRTSTAKVSARYWEFDSFIRDLESRIASTIGAHGPLFSIRRELYTFTPLDLIDDFYVSLAVLHQGYRVIQAPDFVGQKLLAAKRIDEYHRKIRIACQAVNVHRTLAPYLHRQSLLVRYLYFGHKTSRWLTGFFLAIAMVLISLALWWHRAFSLIFALWAFVGATICLGSLHLEPFASMLDAAIALAANGVGLAQSIRGRKYRTWTSPQSARHEP